MRTGAASPTVAPRTSILEALGAISEARAGAVSVVDRAGKLLGIFTDGDFRRQFARGRLDLAAAPVGEHMTAKPVSIGPEQLATEALALMRARKIDELPVVDRRGRLVGMLDVQDLLSAGLV